MKKTKNNDKNSSTERGRTSVAAGFFGLFTNPEGGDGAQGAKKADYFRRQREVDFRKEPLPSMYQRERERLSLSIEDLWAEIFQAQANNVAYSADELVFCAPLTAYLIARHPDIWCKIDPYLEAQALGRAPSDSEKAAMVRLAKVSPLFELKSRYLQVFGKSGQ